MHKLLQRHNEQNNCDNNDVQEKLSFQSSCFFNSKGKKQKGKVSD